MVRAYVKGAPDSSWRGPGRRARGATLPTGVKDRVLAENTRLGRQGLRVMATAQRDFDPATFEANAADLWRSCRT